MKYNPALDGLRAYAAMAVIAYHTGIVFFWPGWVGVHFFFVLSGFLITTILLNSKSSANYFKVFYSRRFLRIVPIYYMVLLCTIILALLSKKDIGSVWWYVFYLQNFKLASVSDHIHHFPTWMDHTWTLAIEEQFYILFPLLVKFLSEKILAVVCFVLILVSVLFRYYMSVLYPDNTLIYEHTLSNIDFLTAGALLSIGYKHFESGKILLALYSVFAIFFIVLLWLTKDSWLHPIYMVNKHRQLLTIGLLLFTSITIFTLAARKNKIIKLFFENSFVVYIGKISYGIYLYHLPFFGICDYFSIHYFASAPEWQKHGYLLVLAKLAGTIIISALSFRFIETRISRLKKKLNYKFEPGMQGATVTPK